MHYLEILQFWFEEIESKFWFKKDTSFDQLITERFLDVYKSAAAGECYSWRESSKGRLAEIIVLDQFPRNIFRDKPESFATDNQALVLAQEAVAGDHLANLAGKEQAFLLMPYMHSESSLIHEKALVLFDKPGLESNLEFEQKHKAIIDRFGRYPHRNKILGRVSTAQELEFLKQPGSSF